MTVKALNEPQVETASREAAGFAAVLRERTQAVHREAERSGYIADLLRGRGTRTGYALYLASLLPAYETLERHLAVAPHSPALSPFAAPALFRLAALRRDLQAIAETGEEPPTLPEALAYAAAVESAAQGDGAGLIAHAYARYLGDLSGGQILKSLLARTLDLKPEQLTFYDFPEIADIPAYKTTLRDALNSIDPASRNAMRVVDESIAAFHHTIAVSSAVSKAMQPL